MVTMQLRKSRPRPWGNGEIRSYVPIERDLAERMLFRADNGRDARQFSYELPNPLIQYIFEEWRNIIPAHEYLWDTKVLIAHIEDREFDGEYLLSDYYAIQYKENTTVIMCLVS